MKLQINLLKCIMMSIRFTGEDDESKAWNMNVANPDGKIFFVTRGGPDSMY